MGLPVWADGIGFTATPFVLHGLDCQMVEPVPVEQPVGEPVAGESAPTPRPNLILVRYGEIGLKSRSVRNRFERQLVDNLLDQLELAGVAATVERPQGRIIVHADPVEPAIDPVSRTFGVVSFSPAHLLPTSDRERLTELAAALAAPLLTAQGPGTTFGVQVRRTGSHPYTSMELAGEAGAAILQAVPQARVQLKAPRVQVTMEVRQNQTYAMVESLPGVGGLPLGSQGRVAALIDSQEALVAAWLLAKRGCRCRLIVAQGMEEGLAGTLEAFRAWHPRVKMVPLGPSPLDNGGKAKLLDAALERAREGRAQALMLGWGVETIEGLPAEPGMPIFLPLMGLTPAEVKGYLETLLAQRAMAIHPLEAPHGSGRRSRA